MCSAIVTRLINVLQHHIVRMWDSYISDGDSECGGFASFHVYVCAAFLWSVMRGARHVTAFVYSRWSKQLRQLDFQEIMLFLQRLPTDDWANQDVELLVNDCGGDCAQTTRDQLCVTVITGIRVGGDIWVNA
jgi:hypothetical protein